MSLKDWFSFGTLLKLSLVLPTALAATYASAETVLRTVNISDIRTTSPLEDSDGPTFHVLNHILEGLVAFDDKASLVPMLAESYDVSADGLTYTFKLRPDVRFQNGAQLKAGDVVFAWNTYLGKSSGWRCKPDFTGKGQSKITDISAADEHTVVFKLDRPWALFLGTMARIDCMQAGIFQRDSIGADGKWIKPVGTGPFQIGDWQHGKHLDLDAFKGYSARTEPKTGLGGNKTPLVDRVRLLVIPDPASARAALMAGNIDIIAAIQPADMKELKADKNIVVNGSPSFALAGVLFGLQPSPMNDVRVRRALAHALDYNAIAQVAMEGLSPPNNSPVPSTSAFYSPVTATLHKTDLALSKKLLAEAGYKGERIKITTNNRNPYALQSSIIIQAMASQVGINIDIETLEFGAYISKYLKGDYQIAVMGFGARLDPSLTIDSIAGDRSVEARKVWNDPAALKLLQESMEESDTAKRQALFDQLHKMFLDTVPMIQLFNVAEAYAVRRNVKGFTSWSGGTPRFWGVSVSQN